MTELEAAAQEIVEYFEAMAKKYGRVTEILKVKPKIERLRKAIELNSRPNCQHCGGDGKIYRGDRWVTCTVCKGTGKQLEEEE